MLAPFRRDAVLVAIGDSLPSIAALHRSAVAGGSVQSNAAKTTKHKTRHDLGACMDFKNVTYPTSDDRTTYPPASNFGVLGLRATPLLHTPPLDWRKERL